MPAHAAATALREDTSADAAWRRSLETAIAVCYMRPFTKGAWTLPSKYMPESEPWRRLHERLRDLRNEVYAHSDTSSGRSASMTTKSTSGDLVTIEYRGGWQAFPVEDLPAVQALCYDQRERFRTEAATIHVELGEADEDV
jgi:hypothetical protein